jgi:muramoyltetrapeptide carboxypeptidase
LLSIKKKEAFKELKTMKSPEFYWPPPLCPGEVVAVAAPASHVSRAPWEAGIRMLREWGFVVRSGAEVLKPRSWGVATDQLVARRFEELWLDPEVKAVIGVRGGYGSLKILPHLDLAALKKTPKRLVGFSDLTNLLWDLHGPVVAQLPELTIAARENFYMRLTAPAPQRLSYPGLTVVHPGAAVGPLAGGNLTTLCHLVGTPYAPQFDGYLLFLEDHNEPLYRLDRMLHHLLLAGVLDGVAGVVLGSFINCGSADGLLEVCTTALAPLKVPVLADFPAGHQPDNHTLPLGAPAHLDADTAYLTFLA